MDTTLKFALSALWNLTDEMPTAARNFIECQGLELYEEVLEVEDGDITLTDRYINREMNPHTGSKTFLLSFFVCCSPTTPNHQFSRKCSASWWVQCFPRVQPALVFTACLF